MPILSSNGIKYPTIIKIALMVFGSLKYRYGARPSRTKLNLQFLGVAKLERGSVFSQIQRDTGLYFSKIQVVQLNCQI